jgi:ATP adenylyltransferase
VRPQFVLHTIDVEPQIDGLDAEDFGAARDVLRQIGERYIGIFNCGKDAGASVEHKHLQVIPKAEHVDNLPFATQRGGGETLGSYSSVSMD